MKLHGSFLVFTANSTLKILRRKSMDKETYEILDTYMQACMAADTAHDKNHIYRVLYAALTIAEHEVSVDYDCLITACLLHDIGRKEQFENPNVCHAKAGAKKAGTFLREHGFPEPFISHVSDCIRTHRFRAGQIPESIEAKILFDADKLDVTGAIGIARTLAYKGQHATPLYFCGTDGNISERENDNTDSFFHEYRFKLEGMYDRFYTQAGKEMAAIRKKAAADFYHSMLTEVQKITKTGSDLLDKQIQV